MGSALLQHCFVPTHGFEDMCFDMQPPFLRTNGTVHGADDHNIPMHLQVSALVAHLAFIRIAGDLGAATALADTFGTSAFIAAARAARLPNDIADNLRDNCTGEVPEGLPPSAGLLLRP